ncbi:MAG: hypothetical protein QNK23_00600 [Crocinitomicaceae bacterium]|nr:hypothetical protein [Crocinitomicaceae bacterium]
MKIIGLVASLFFVFTSIGQKSYYFSAPTNSMGQNVSSIDAKYFGNYAANAEARSYEFTSEGITIVSTSISSISRETIRESSKYTVRNNFLLGVVEGDSVPCILEGEFYIFGVRNRDVLIGSGSKTLLTKLSTTKYIIHHYENGLYTPEIMRFEGSKLIFEVMDYDFETTAFDHVAEKKNIPSEHFEIVVLSPTKDEFNQLLQNGTFVESSRYKKKRS